MSDVMHDGSVPVPPAGVPRLDGPHGPMRAALDRCRRHIVAAAGFSALVNLLYIVPTLYMLQVYDRVVPTRGLQTLLFLTLVLLFALGVLALLDRIRSRLLVRAGIVLDAAVSIGAGQAPPPLRQRSGSVAGIPSSRSASPSGLA